MDGPPIAAHLEVQVQGGVQFSFRVTNNEPRKVELMFPSGQTHDFVVIDSVGREMWRWSEDRMFTQVVTTRLLDSGATLTWDAECGATLPPGRYTAIGLLTSENKPMEQRVTFEVK